MRPEIKAAIDRYAKDGVPTGGFLRAVLSNDLKMAFAKADIENQMDMKEIVAYCYNEIPGNCWGSPENVKEWIENKAKEREERSESTG